MPLTEKPRFINRHRHKLRADRLNPAGAPGPPLYQGFADLDRILTEVQDSPDYNNVIPLGLVVNRLGEPLREQPVIAENLLVNPSQKN